MRAFLPIIALAAFALLQVAAFATDAVFEGLDPLQWASEPHARFSHTITMSAEPVASPGEVEYNFVCTAGGAPDSGWQASQTYSATGLKPETAYTFVARVRDKATASELRAPALPITVTTRKADKYDQIVANDIELIPLLVNGNKNNRINIVVVNRWTKGESNAYNKPEMRETFLKDARDATIPGLTFGDKNALTPLPNLRSFFNVYALWWPSIPPWDPPAYEKGEWAGHWEVYNEVRERLFLPWQREGRGWVTHLAMINSRGGGGGAGLLLDERVGDAMIEGNEVSGFYHEFAHTALCIGDTYVGWGIWGSADESENTTLVFQRERIPWKAWIDPQTPVPTPYNRKYLRTIGLFEGGTHRTSGLFRPTPVCIMGVNPFADRFCALCVQRAYQSSYAWVDAIDSAVPARAEVTLEQPGRARFSISRVKPTPDTQKVEWRLNGKVIARDVDAVEVEVGALAEYELVCSLVDRTEFIRDDPPFASYPRAERRWKIVNPNPLSYAEPLKTVLKASSTSCCGANDGAVTASVSGGKPPYTYLWSTGSSEPQIRGLDAGKYLLQVWDSEFREAKGECAVERPITVTVDARSHLEKGRWRVVMDVRGDDPKNVTCKWSTGANGLVLNGLADGRYRYTVTHKRGGTITGEVTLAKPARPLRVKIAEAIPSTGENNGQIRLAVTGGRKPYQVAWADGPKQAGMDRAFLPPGVYRAVVKDANLTAVETAITIKDEEAFSLERPVFEKSPTGGVRIANPRKGYRYLWYAKDYPSYIPTPPRGVYEGTFRTKDGRVVEAHGAVVANTNGKWVNEKDMDPENDGSTNDYGSWVRLDAYVSGRHKPPMTIRLKTNHNGERGQKLDVSGETVSETVRWKLPDEVPAAKKWKGTVDRGRLVVVGEDPDQGERFDLLYTSRHENGPDRPVYAGTDFHPSKAGNYYIAAQKEDTGAISYNRVGVAITMDLAPQVKKTGDGYLVVTNPKPDYEYVWYESREGGVPIAKGIRFKPRTKQACYVASRRTRPFWDKPLKPDAVTGSKPLLWLDASDMDGDGVEDAKPWERGSLLGWHGKPGRMSPGGFIIYEPNILNGKPVASWQWIWWQRLQKPVTGYQTIIMVFRNHDLSKEGTGPWGGVDAYLWDLRGKKALDKVAPEFRSGTAWVNGEKVDPYATPPPMEFCIATFELSAKSNKEIDATSVDWEGAVAEFIAYDGKISEDERRGVEEYLRHKWISAVHLESPRVAARAPVKR